MTRPAACNLLLSFASLLIAAGCTSSDRPTAPFTKPEFAISDAVHENGTPGFYFLPPMVVQPTFSGTFDADITTLNPAIAICDITNSPDLDCGNAGGTPAVLVFTTATTPAITSDPPSAQYQVNWDTRGAGFVAGRTYRVHVTAGASGTRRELGFADVLLTTAPGRARDVATGDLIVVNVGRTLPIHFRIETGIPGSLGVSAAAPSITGGGTDLITATVRDLHGALLSAVAVAWSVTTTPTTGVADPSQPLNPTSGHTGSAGTTATTFKAGATSGTATVTATSEGTSGQATVTVAQFVTTGIHGIESFLDQCPTNDPAYAQIRQDFELLADGQPDLSPITCTEPISTLPIDQLTDELIAVQVLRTAYYMSMGTQGKLPWTPKSLYAWMSSNIDGIDLKTAPGQLFCCELINGKTYFVASRQDAFNRDFKRTWFGISSSLNFYAHEIHHADPGAPGHVNGCPAFPLPSDPLGCDATYDLTNLGSYGVQYWLESNWATGYLNIGIGCSSFATAMAYATWDANSANGFRDRFVTNVPPVVTAPQPYGGPCV